jgi:dephospho-CoA kinase
MLKIGITGGIGTGKSTLCRIFKILGIPDFNSDEVAQYLMVHNLILKEKIQYHFGKDIYFTNGELDRNKLSALVFTDPHRLKILDSLVHPAVFQAFDDWAQSFEKMNSPGIPFLIKEAALLFESGTWVQNDLNILVCSPLRLRIQRIKERNGWSEEKIRVRMNNQMPDSEKLKLADYIIYNDPDHSLTEQVIALFQIFKDPGFQKRILKGESI